MDTLETGIDLNATISGRTTMEASVPKTMVTVHSLATNIACELATSSGKVKRVKTRGCLSHYPSSGRGFGQPPLWGWPKLVVPTATSR